MHSACELSCPLCRSYRIVSYRICHVGVRQNVNRTRTMFPLGVVHNIDNNRAIHLELLITHCHESSSIRADNESMPIDYERECSRCIYRKQAMCHCEVTS